MLKHGDQMPLACEASGMHVISDLAAWGYRDIYA